MTAKETKLNKGDKMGKIYAVDFDGTLCRGTHYPAVSGSPNYYLIEFLKEKRHQGNIVILWTCREGEALDQAVKWCKKYGLEFDYINENTEPNRKRYGNNCRKIFAHYYIDDHNLTVNDLTVKAAGLDSTIWQRSLELMCKEAE